MLLNFGHDALVNHFDTEVAPRLEAFRLAAANDPVTALRHLYETGEEVEPQVPQVQRTLQRVAAGVIECQLMSRLSLLHARWPKPPNALARIASSAVCRRE